MKNKGFTLVELLAVIILLGILMVLAIPAYLSVFNNIKRSNLDNKVSEIQTAALKYGEKYKDLIKSSSCMTTTIGELITLGYIESEDNVSLIINNPVTNAPLTGTVYICYCTKDYELTAYYTEPYSASTRFYKGQYVLYNNALYVTMVNTPNSGVNINATDSSSRKYFEKVDFTNRC